MNGIGDFVTSLKETHRLTAQIVIELKGDTPGHPFRGNQYDSGGSGGESGAPSFEDVYGNPDDWSPREVDRYGQNMLRDMRFDTGSDGRGNLTVTGNKDEYEKVKGIFPSTTLLSKFESKVLGTRYLTGIDVKKKVNKKIVADYVRNQYATQGNE